MNLLFLIFLSINSNRVVEVRFTEKAPVIDGIIEDIWKTADSAYNFIQFDPYEKSIPTEKTVVYVLQDRENLYIAFQCYAEKHKPTAVLTADEDDIRIGIDPFGSKSTAYYFQVYASGIINDGWILDDGRNFDDSWDGVWFRAVKVYDDRFIVEVKIPFKSLRYKKGLDKWGITFARYIASNRETDCWNEFLQREGVLVSKYGKLKGIRPQATGYYFELYPEGFVRYDKIEKEKGKVKPSLSMNFKWDLTPQITLNATVYPDFAQIEADPFTLNLSRYPIYLDERRPFFLAGKDIFRMSDFGEHKGFFDPLNIFYSRRIGKSIDGQVTPIIGGLKLTSKAENWNLGVLGAYTDEYKDIDSLIEPRRLFVVLRSRRRAFENSHIGVLLSGTTVGRNEYNYALGLDGVYRKGMNQFILQTAASDKNGKMGWAVTSGYFGMIKKFLTIASAEVVQDSFDVSDIGYVPWAGRKKFVLLSGPYRNYPKGFLRELYISPGIVVIQEPGDSNCSKLGILEINPNFRNQFGFDLSFTAGPYYQADTNYFYKELNLSVWGKILGNHINFGGNYAYTYNYSRDFLAYRGSHWLSYRYSIIPKMSISLSSNLWVEWDTLNTIIAITPRLTPRINIRMNADMSLDIFNEFVFTTPGTNFSEGEWLTNRFGFLFSWNFRPKSWIYIAINDYRVRNDEGILQIENQIGAIKAKYLMYF